MGNCPVRQFALGAAMTLWLWSAPALPEAATQPQPDGSASSSRVAVGPHMTYSAHGTLEFDPSKCSHDPKGMVYFAVGRRVFRQPMKNLVYITGGSPKWRIGLPTPPKPDDPDGCPDHPIQGYSYTIDHISAMSDDKPSIVSDYVAHISIVIHDGTDAYTEDGLFDLLSKSRGTDDDAIPGLVGSKKPPEKAYYVAYKAKSYLTPDGKSLTVACESSIWSDASACDYGYPVYPDMVIWARFTTANEPLTELLNSDRELRRRIEASQVQDYQWLNSKADN